MVQGLKCHDLLQEKEAAEEAKKLDVEKQLSPVMDEDADAEESAEESPEKSPMEIEADDDEPIFGEVPALKHPAAVCVRGTDLFVGDRETGLVHRCDTRIGAWTVAAGTTPRPSAT